MTRLEFLLNPPKEAIRYPKDIALLRESIPELAKLDDATIQKLYHSYSEDMWCASWLILDKNFLQEFREYLLDEVIL
jgi:hypothetical protein